MRATVLIAVAVLMFSGCGGEEQGGAPEPAIDPSTEVDEELLSQIDTQLDASTNELAKVAAEVVAGDFIFAQVHRINASYHTNRVLKLARKLEGDVEYQNLLILGSQINLKLIRIYKGIISALEEGNQAEFNRLNAKRQRLDRVKEELAKEFEVSDR